MAYLPDRLVADLKPLPRGLRDHVERVGEICRGLAGRYGYDGDKAKATAVAHDIARAMSGAEILDLARRFSLEASPVERALPILLHGPVGAELLRRDYGLVDEEMLGAIACHTNGKPGMGTLDKLLFLADKIDPEKIGRCPALDEVRQLAATDLDRALLKYFDLELAALVAGSLLIHPSMVEARNHLLILGK